MASTEPSNVPAAGRVHGSAPNSQDFPTAGEKLAGRTLSKETRAGVEHYIPGQHEATIYAGIEYGTDRPAEIGRVTYVDQMDHLCVVLAYRHTDESEEWYATWLGRAGQTWKSEARKIEPHEFALSERMLAALADAPYVDVPFPIDEKAAG